MTEVLVAAFRTVAEADHAVQALEGANVPSSMIRRYHRDDPAIPIAGHLSTTEPEQRQSGGFWSWLLGEEGSQSYHADENYYRQTIDAGNTVVAVHVEPADSDRIMILLSQYDPIALEEGATGTVGIGAATMRDTTEETTRGQTEERIPLAEEEVQVGKRRVEQPVQVRRYVVERPLEQQVNLKDERVVVERRRPVAGEVPTTGAAFEDRTVEVHESHEEPVVSKTAKVGEEVVVRKETGERTETVRDTVRKEDVEVDRSAKRG